MKGRLDGVLEYRAAMPVVDILSSADNII